MYLFTTTESDSHTITKDNGKYYCKRYGLPTMEISENVVKNIAWFELNRRGRFEHLVNRENEGIPTMTNKPAQQFLVTRALQYGIN